MTKTPCLPLGRLPNLDANKTTVEIEQWIPEAYKEEVALGSTMENAEAQI